MKVYPLKVNFNYQGKEEAIYPVLLKSEEALILVDCGYPGFMPLLEEAAKLHGFTLKDLTGIIITHDDIDHVGGLFEIKARYPHVKVFSSKIEAPYISGNEKSLRLVQAEALYESLEEAQKPGAIKFQEMLRGIQ